MFSRPHRLSKTRNVQDVLRHGRAFFSPTVNIKFLRKPESDTLRFTVVVSAKVSKRAVVRNRVKRIFREEIKSLMDLMPKGDWVIFAKPAVANLDRPSLHEISRKALQDAITHSQRTTKPFTRNISK